ncbi:uncharacterized protein LOC144867758 isoform X2 [Branchiostoma floridae x Branchiostoma japonicum]
MLGRQHLWLLHQSTATTSKSTPNVPKSTSVRSKSTPTASKSINSDVDSEDGFERQKRTTPIPDKELVIRLFMARGHVHAEALATVTLPRQTRGEL